MGIKKNFAYNLILTAGNYIFPLITYPYISRVLGVSNIGICNYIDSIINYFILFSMLGVSSLGVREIAKAKNDTFKCSEVFSSLVWINFILTILSSIILLIVTFYIPFFAQYKKFLLIGLFKLVFNVFLTEWFFQGISNFKYITIRSLIIKIGYVLSVFIFVKTQDDITIYYFLTSIIVVINASTNWLYSQKYINFNFKNIHINIYIIAVISYGIYRILSSMYTTFNVTFLGSTTSSVQVGYFTTATKLYTIFMSIFTAFTTVMIPKISELLNQSEYKKMRNIANITFNLIYAFSIPIIIISFSYAPIIISIIAGNGYEGAIIPFQIVMPLLLIIAMEQIIIQQFLMATQNSRCIITLSATGAVIGVIMNILLIAKYKAVGAAISWTLSETSILIVAIYYFKKLLKLSVPILSLLKHILFSIPYVIICYIFLDNKISINVFIGLLLCLLWFIISNIYFLKNNLITTIIHKHQ